MASLIVGFSRGTSKAWSPLRSPWLWPMGEYVASYRFGVQIDEMVSFQIGHQFGEIIPPVYHADEPYKFAKTCRNLGVTWLLHDPLEQDIDIEKIMARNSDEPSNLLSVHPRKETNSTTAELLYALRYIYFHAIAI